jgi:ubiquinone/menaquinone biosynthesis C-methylase UbiE
VSDRRDVSGWNRNIHYHGLVVNMMPSPCSAALDVGCGAGMLVRVLAGRAESVTGIDASNEMAEMAQRGDPDATIAHGDFLTYDFGSQRFDFITCVAALHHMDLQMALERMKSLLHPNGVIAIIGLAKTGTMFDFGLDCVGFIASRIVRLHRPVAYSGAPIKEPERTYGDVKRTASAVLPGAVFRRLLLFRYLLTWRNTIR